MSSFLRSHWLAAYVLCSCTTSASRFDGDAMAPALGPCDEVEDAFGFGMHAEGQCAPAEYTGPGIVSDVSSPVTNHVDYYVELTEADAGEDCPYPSRVWISTTDRSPPLPLAVGDRVTVGFHTVTELEGRNLFVYVTITEESSGRLLFMHHQFDDRFFREGRLQVADTFELRLVPSCEFEAPCYEQAIRQRVRDPQWDLDVGEFESTIVDSSAGRFGVYVTSSRYSEGFSGGACFAGHYEPGYRVALQIVAE